MLCTAVQCGEAEKSSCCLHLTEVTTGLVSLGVGCLCSGCCDSDQRYSGGLQKPKFRPNSCYCKGYGDMVDKILNYQYNFIT